MATRFMSHYFVIQMAGNLKTSSILCVWPYLLCISFRMIKHENHNKLIAHLNQDTTGGVLLRSTCWCIPVTQWIVLLVGMGVERLLVITCQAHSAQQHTFTVSEVRSDRSVENLHVLTYVPTSSSLFAWCISATIKQLSYGLFTSICTLAINHIIQCEFLWRIYIEHWTSLTTWLFWPRPSEAVGQMH